MFSTKEVRTFWNGDLFSFVKETYGFDFELHDFYPDGVSQDSYEEYSVNDGYGLLYDERDLEIVKEWISTNEIPLHTLYDGSPYPALSIRHILYRMLKDGHIEPGNYLMTIWW